jgi:hypothetical protein
MLSFERVIPSTNEINITGQHIFNTTAQKNPERLFDDDLTTKLDADGSAGTIFATPMEWWIVLDSTYQNMKLDYYHSTGPSSWTVKVYSADKLSSQTFTFSGVFASWATVTNFHTVAFPIRYIFFSATDPQTGVMEMKIYGDAVAEAANILPPTDVVQPLDPGIKFQGVGSLDDKDTNYMRNIAGSWRLTGSAFTFSHTPGAAWGAMPLHMQFYGDLKARKLTFFKDRNIESQLYIGGASITTCGTCTAGDGFVALSNATNIRKDIPPGSDSTLTLNWSKNHGRMWRALSHLYGSNTSSTLAADYSITGTTLTAGQNVLKYYEIGNEDNKTWIPLPLTLAAYHNPKVLLAKLKVAYDSIKASDGNAKVILGATTYIDTTLWKGMWFLNYWNYNGAPFPADGIAFNQYIHDGYSGQPKGINTNSAISPERFRIYDHLNNTQAFMGRYFPGFELRWTEFGYATDAGSNYNVVSIGGLSTQDVKAMFGIRTLELAAATGLDRMYWYWYNHDNTTDFGTMEMLTFNFGGGGEYTGSTRLPIWYRYAVRYNTHKNYNGWATMLANGDSTSNYVTVKTHLTNPDSALVAFWKGSSNGSTSTNYTLPIEGIQTATLVTMGTNDSVGTKTVLTVVNGQVVIPTVTEAVQYVQLLMAGNSAPSGGIGVDKFIILPLTSTTLSASFDDISPMTYLWTKLTPSPSGGNIASPTSAITAVTDLIPGYYRFKVEVSDGSLTARDTVTVYVMPTGSNTYDEFGRMRYDSSGIWVYTNQARIVKKGNGKLTYYFNEEALKGVDPFTVPTKLFRTYK